MYYKDLSKDEALQLIHDLCVDYDGAVTVEDFKMLIDDIVEIVKAVI